MDYRIEKDTLGEVKVPFNVYWGPQTERSRKNFKIGPESSMPIEIIYGFAILKKAAAYTNHELGVLEIKKREILDSKDYEEVARLCANLLQQNTIKDHLIKNCIGKIGALEARLIQLEIDNERPLWQSLFKKVFHQCKDLRC